MMGTSQAQSVDTVVKRAYRVWEDSEQEKVMPKVKEFIRETFHDVSINDEDNTFTAKYKGKRYEGKISDSHEKAKVPLIAGLGFPHEVIKGEITIELNFQGPNQHNKRVVRMLERDLVLPYKGIDYSGL